MLKLSTEESIVLDSARNLRKIKGLFTPPMSSLKHFLASILPSKRKEKEYTR